MQSVQVSVFVGGWVNESWGFGFDMPGIGINRSILTCSQ